MGALYGGPRWSARADPGALCKDRARKHRAIGNPLHVSAPAGPGNAWKSRVSGPGTTLAPLRGRASERLAVRAERPGRFAQTAACSTALIRPCERGLFLAILAPPSCPSQAEAPR